MANNLQEHLKKTADAIIEKKCTTDLINPQDFSAEILSIESGPSAGGVGGGVYIDVSNIPTGETKNNVIKMLLPISGKNSDGFITLITEWEGEYDNVVAIASGFDVPALVLDGKIMTFREAMALDGLTLDAMLAEVGAFEITKDQYFQSNN